MKTDQEVKVNTVKTVANVCLASCQKLLAQIEQAKRRLAAEFQESFKVHEELFRLAMTEAEALAWQTEFPQLFFPTLAMEKVQEVTEWQSRQDSVRRHSVRLVNAA